MRMKKSLAVILAAMMVASMGSVAFAAQSDEDVRIDVDGGYYKYDKDSNKVVFVGNSDNGQFAPGDTIYIPLDNDLISAQGIKNSEVNRYKVFADWNVGSTYVSKMELKYVKSDLQTGGVTTYYYKVSGIQDANGIPYSQLNGNYSGATKDAAKAAFTAALTKFYNEQVLAPKVEAPYQAAKNASGTVTNNAGASTYKMNYNLTAADGEFYNQLKDIASYDSLADMTAQVNKVRNDKKQAITNSANTAKTNIKAKLDAITDGSLTYTVLAEDVPADTDAVGLIGKVITRDGSTTFDQALDTLITTYVSDKHAEFDGYAATIIGAGVTEVKAPATEYTYKVSGLTGAYAVLNGKEYKAATEAAAKNAYVQDVDGIKASETTSYKNAFDAATKSPTVKEEKDAPVSTGYAWFAAIQTKSNSTTKVLDIVGEVDVARTSSKAKSFDGFNFAVGLTNGEYEDPNASGSISIDEGTGSVVSFDRDAGDVDITWGNDLAMFEVNATGQGSLNLTYNTKYNADFADRYPNANIDFLNFPATPSFNRTGTLYIYADEDTFIYEATSSGAKKISGAVYDDTYGAWKFKTRTLSSYAISDKRLNTTFSSSSSSSSSNTSSSSSSQSSSSKPSSSSGGITGGGLKPNPDTGR